MQPAVYMPNRFDDIQNLYVVSKEAKTYTGSVACCRRKCLKYVEFQKSYERIFS